MSIGDRLRIYLGAKKVNRKEFCEAVDIPYNSLSHMLGNGRNMSSDTLNKIFTYFPNLNSRWLVTGKGPMEYTVEAYHLAEEEKTNVCPVETITVDKEELIPIYVGRGELEKLVSELVRKEIKKL
ncbi:helix-turn-helix transcriptional regulator [Myroides odoratimimus]|uniref:helix-turn-helix domain-containing protein n=1 Tax=Myroides odoratimimus TaxID=76832 RepID=UPI00257916D4|nr:helix-turn-helix domain-containing protein [Myroides odoratimimus]MDM1441882.1 helix-turn-helix transcriptional regulator [Myroides odoratimimus]